MRQGLLRSVGQVQVDSLALSHAGTSLRKPSSSLFLVQGQAECKVGARPSSWEWHASWFISHCWSLYLKQMWSSRDPVRQVPLPEKQEEGRQAGRTFRNWLVLGDLLATVCVPSIGTHTCKPMPWGLETYRIRWEEGEKC